MLGQVSTANVLWIGTHPYGDVRRPTTSMQRTRCARPLPLGGAIEDGSLKLTQAVFTEPDQVQAA